VVEDDAALLESLESFLSRRGHKVKAFRSATEAWDSLVAEDSSPAVIIADLTLQGMSGQEFIRRVMKRDPTVAVIATSGYPMLLASLGLPKEARVALLQKPFSPRMLTEALDGLFGRSPV